MGTRSYVLVPELLRYHTLYVPKLKSIFRRYFVDTYTSNIQRIYGRILASGILASGLRLKYIYRHTLDLVGKNWM